MSTPASVQPRRSRRALLAGLACAGALTAGSVAVGGPAATVGAAPGDTEVQILAFNDYHGHVKDDTANFNGDKGGGEFLSAKLTELRAGQANTLTVAAGDLIGGSPFFSGLFHDEPSVESLNAMGLDVSGVGNHEFDEGVTELLRMQNGGCHPVDGCYFDDPMTVPIEDEYAGADFQWLAANVTRDPLTAPVETATFDTDIPDYTIRDAGDGKKIAFIGMTLEGTSELVAASGIVGFTFEDEVATANALVPVIQADDPTVEAIVVLLHEGGIPNPIEINGCSGITGPIVQIAEDLDPEIDAIISGHTHLPYTCTIDDPDNNPRSVTSAQSFGLIVTELSLELDADGEVDRDTVTAVNHEVVHSELTADPAVTAVIDKWSPLADERGNDPIGSITADITRGGDPTGSDRGVESAAGNLVADAQLEATAGLGAEVALMNPGGVRSDLVFAESGEEGDGVVTYGEAFTFQPFNNTMFVLPMTGAQLVSVLEEQCQPGDSSRPVLLLGVSDGLTYDLDITQQDGVCTSVEVSNVMLNGSPVLPAAMYQVATNNFLADGGDNFDTFAEVDPNDRIPGPQDIDALTDYLGANSPVAPPSTDRVNETGMTLPSSLVSLEPARLLETRTGPNNMTTDGEFLGAGRIAAGGEVELQVTERGNVAGNAVAVVLNVGVVAPSEGGFATIYPCGTERPQASSVNFGADTASNAVFAKVGDEGAVCIYTSAEAHLIADVLSFVPADGSPAPVDPARLLETRVSPTATTIDGDFEGDGPIAAGGEVELKVTERGEVPDDATAVVLNVGAIRPTEGGFFTVYPCGIERPQASSLNFAAGAVTSNSVTADIGDDGTVCIYSSVATDAIADVNAYVQPSSSLGGIEPARLLETRVSPTATTVDGMFEGDGPVAAGETVELAVASRGDVPADARTVVLNVGAVRPTERGFITVYTCGDELPGASNVNYVGGDVVSNAVVAEVGDDGTVCIYTSATTDIIVDVTAVVTPPTPHRI